MTQHLFAFIGPHSGNNNNLAMLTYTGHERVADWGMLIVAGFMWVFCLVRAIRGRRNRPWTRKTQNAVAGLPIFAVIILGLILGLLFAHPHRYLRVSRLRPVSVHRVAQLGGAILRRTERTS